MNRVKYIPGEGFVIFNSENIRIPDLIYQNVSINDMWKENGKSKTAVRTQYIKENTALYGHEKAWDMWINLKDSIALKHVVKVTIEMECIFEP